MLFYNKITELEGIDTTEESVITTAKGTFRVVSNISYDEIVCLFETSDLDEKFGYL